MPKRSCFSKFPVGGLTGWIDRNLSWFNGLLCSVGAGPKKPNFCSPFCLEKVQTLYWLITSKSQVLFPPKKTEKN